MSSTKDYSKNKILVEAISCMDDALLALGRKNVKAAITQIGYAKTAVRAKMRTNNTKQ